MEKYNLPKGYLSASSISTFLRCGYQFKFRYVDNIIAPPNIALVQGSAAHSTFENYYNTLLSGGTRMTPEEVKDSGVHFLEEQIEKNDVKLEDKILDQSRREIEIVSESYIRNVAEEITPVAVEQEVRYELEGCGVEILAYLDLVHEENGADRLADYKITGKKWNINQLRNSLQFKLYALCTGIEDIEVHNIVRTTKTPKVFNKLSEEGVREVASNIRILPNKFEIEKEEHFLEEQIEAVAKAISSGIFIPTDPGNWCCNPQWCGYWGRCRGKK